MSPLPGQVLVGRYRLDAHIATGGMGEVWRAEDTRLHRVVAVKILSPGLAQDATFRERFAAEARTVAALRVPGVVGIYDAVETVGEDGRPLAFLVMEHVPGVTLAALLDEEGRLEPDRAMSMLAQAADALDAAHLAGIVHRDVKPDNIIVGEDDRVTLVDFGVARVKGEATLTAAGSILATIRYAAPEQLSGVEIGPSADIYALGVVAHECLAGEAPFNGESTAAIVAGHLLRPPPPLPLEVPAAAATVVSKALAKEPERRYASAAAFAAACRDDASPAGTHRLRTGAIAAAALVVVAALVVWRIATPPNTEDADATASGTTVAGTTDVPPTPTDSRVTSASTGQCLDVESEVRLADCGPAATISFSGADGTYLLALDEDGERRCLAAAEARIEARACDRTEGWAVTWLGADEGRDRWRMESTTYAGRCLSVAETTQDEVDATGEGKGHGKGKGNGHGKGKKDESRVYQSPGLASCGTGDEQVWLTG
ncbi:serine/threonine-protein kinase [Phytomonospora endophytica]|uniref:non-specific serine/threonine protein kinase n=1 Tax=Phytomonospora endophytica TaxID=714109 RepID=A0A841FQZ3_9ACTN|nr:serine/threonine-protein kinase [Phytomonospora endophytica]MBB6036208.1 putative Ser/Thr protein kinase [Phytomonospora endophytica]GIG67114.1 hypothetical protein Pen01_34090 [Phytomonospora endophytica]